jgi:hypothetical protein
VGFEVSAHTPGPWVAELDESPLFVKPSSMSYPVICDMVPRDADCFTQEDEANARLIAAAPDLLEALRPIAERGEISGSIIAAAKAAFAKATSP